MLHIDSQFDSGNIIIQSIDNNKARLRIAKDKGSDFFQWFHFRVASAIGTDMVLEIEGLLESAYPDGWPDYRALVSTDRRCWTRADTQYDSEKGVLTIHHRAESGLSHFAYFVPYSYEQHLDLIADTASYSGVEHEILGYSLDGRPIDCLHIGEGKTQLWIYARQHPGETMAQWWVDGALNFLTLSDNVVARRLRQQCSMHIVPNMNPDGSVRGHLRTNAMGVNLNREWDNPTSERSPEVLAVMQAMEKSGVDLAMDIHGDEAISAAFIAGFEGIPNRTAKQDGLFLKFRSLLERRTPDFQTKLGYPIDPVGKANLAISTNQVAHKFGAMALTLEMPFKDNDDWPDKAYGWSPERSEELATQCLNVTSEILLEE